LVEWLSYACCFSPTEEFIVGIAGIAEVSLAADGY